jgi:uncharacterized protein involved in exopolysaccharide biosynthesis
MNASPETTASNGNGSAIRVTAVERKSVAEPALPAWLEVWQIFWHRKGRIVLMLMLGLAAGALFCFVTGPRYDSSTQLLVLKKRLDTMPITGPDQTRAADDYLSTHMLLITSRKVIGRAIEKGQLQNLAQFQDKGGLRHEVTDWVMQEILGVEPDQKREEKLTTDIINTLVVTRDAQRPGISPSNEVINLSFRGPVASDGPKVLNAIIASYQEFLQETYRNTNVETVELITQARVMVQKDLEAKEAAYQKFLAETPPLWKTHDRSTAQQDRIIKIDAKLAALRLRRSEIEASMAMIENAIKSGRNPTTTVLRMLALPAAEMVASNEPVAPQKRTRFSLEEELVSLQLQKAKLEAIYPKNHADVLAINRELEALHGMVVSEGKGPINLAAIKVELLRQEHDDLKVSEQSLTKLFDAEQKGVGAGYLHEIQDEAHRKGIERDRLMYESILNRLKETSSVRDFGGYNTQVIGPALTGTPAVKRYLLIFGLAAFAGIFAGFGWAYLTELTKPLAA